MPRLQHAQLAAGGHVTCGIRGQGPTGLVECWGSNGNGLDVSWGSTRLAEISVGCKSVYVPSGAMVKLSLSMDECTGTAPANNAQACTSTNFNCYDECWNHLYMSD